MQLNQALNPAKWSAQQVWIVKHLDAGEFYGNLSEDDQSMILKIDYGVNSKTVNGTYNKMPYRLRPMISVLFYELRKKGLI